MKKLILSLALVFAFGTTLTSCRDTKKEEVEINIDDNDDVQDVIDDVEDAVNEGVDEIKENTGTGGTDDN
ncbi:hypothetical protein [Ulvibacter antarcticus]|uniref:Uncharacterized protein n=1 Tax=Ulvibacter antarcticus TaxID=442714 RepID=A0A3L9YSX9_9FLAO|nr:hypothetical protein [Ulvibacter antarcticus]RMA57602.1 hypothetical protein BXY75_2405 [Ulvibacter antarcticus]